MLAAQRLQSLACRPDACIVAHAVKRVRDVKAHGTLPPSDRSRSAGTSTSSSSTATAAAAAVHDGAVSMAPLPASSQTEVPKSHAEQLAQEHQASQAFVNLFRQASPYIEGHRGRTFVITLPGQVAGDPNLLQPLLSDIALLHGLGVRLVVVIGVQTLIDTTLRERGMTPRYMNGYRITDPATLKVTIEVAGEVRTLCEQALSKGPAVPMIRRHAKSENSELHFEPALQVVSGNYVTAKRRGIIEGIDYGLTGEVRFVMKDAIRKQLESGNIVLLSHLGFTAGGEVLNCNVHDVALHAAAELGADKLIFCHNDDEVAALNLPAWLPLSDAQDMLLSRMEGIITGDQMDALLASMDMVELPPHGPSSPRPSESPQVKRNVPASVLTLPRQDVVTNLDLWAQSGFPVAVSTCVIACCKGVKRSHLLDARLDGGLLLELYTRDGVNSSTCTMISSNFFEGIRQARVSDVDGVQAILAPLEKEGTLVKRNRNELESCITDFVVIEREGKLMGCAMLLPLGQTQDGVTVAELGAFTVDPAFRGSGRGDSMLDFVEQQARNMGIRRLALLTTRTADWFEQRDFKHCGPAAESRLLPEARRARINPARNSQLYVKELEVGGAALPRPGKRIGF